MTVAVRRRMEELCQEIERNVGGRDALLELTGDTAFERFSGPQIRKFFQTDPQGYERTAYIGGEPVASDSVSQHHEHRRPSKTTPDDLGLDHVVLDLYRWRCVHGR